MVEIRQKTDKNVKREEFGGREEEEKIAVAGRNGVCVKKTVGAKEWRVGGRKGRKEVCVNSHVCIRHP